MRRIFVALLLVGASASECPVESEIPLDQPSAQLLDSRLVGSWSCRQDEPGELHVRPIGDRELEILSPARQGGAEPSTLRGYTTKVDSLTFLVVQSPESPQSRVRYIIMPYEFESPSSLCLGVVWFDPLGASSPAPRPSTPSSLLAFIRSQLASGTLSPKRAKGGIPPDGCDFLACDRAAVSNPAVPNASATPTGPVRRQMLESLPFPVYLPRSVFGAAPDPKLSCLEPGEQICFWDQHSVAGSATPQTLVVQIVEARLRPGSALQDPYPGSVDACQRMGCPIHLTERLRGRGMRTQVAFFRENSFVFDIGATQITVLTGYLEPGVRHRPSVEEVAVFVDSFERGEASELDAIPDREEEHGNGVGR